MRKWQRNGDQNWRQKQRHFQTSKSWEQFSLGILLEILKKFQLKENDSRRKHKTGGRCIAWFTRETNKTSRQEVCTTYVGRRRPSVLPKERRHWGLPSRILEAQAKLVSLVGSALQMETQPEWERERDMGSHIPLTSSQYSNIIYLSNRYSGFVWLRQCTD